MFIRRRQVDPRAERRSGNNGTTYLMASVKKAGTVSFWWKAQCETLANFLALKLVVDASAFPDMGCMPLNSLVPVVPVVVNPQPLNL